MRQLYTYICLFRHLYVESLYTNIRKTMFCMNSGKFQHLLYHHSNSIKDFMQWCFAHESTGGDDLIFLINMSLIHMFTDVLAAKLRNSFCRVWNIWIPESQRFRQYASVLSFYTNINIFMNNVANSKRQFYIKIHGLV